MAENQNTSTSTFTRGMESELVKKLRLYEELIPSFELKSKPLYQLLTETDELLAEIRIRNEKLEEEKAGKEKEKSMRKEAKSTKKEEKIDEKVQETKENDPETEIEIQNQKPKVVRIVEIVSLDEFRAIPKYQIGRFTLENLNEIVEKIEGFLMNKNKILTKSNKQLTRIDREMLDKWRELEEKSKKRLPSQLFFLESDIRPLLHEKLRPSFIKCIPCLRHIRRIQEERCGPLTFYFPTGQF